MPLGYTYILICSDKSYYVGSTVNLEYRLDQHQSGTGANYTSKRLPVKLVYYEVYEYVWQAFNREKQIQGWSRKKKEALILRDVENLKFASRCQNKSHADNFEEQQLVIDVRRWLSGAETTRDGMISRKQSFLESAIIRYGLEKALFQQRSILLVRVLTKLMLVGTSPATLVRVSRLVPKNQFMLF